MSPAGRRIRDAVERAVTRTRGQAATAVMLAALAVVPGTLAVAWLVGGWPTGAGPLTLVSVTILGVAGVATVLVRRWVLTVDDHALAAAAEAARGLPDGSLRSVLELGERLPDGVSAALLQRSETELADRLAAGQGSARVAGAGSGHRVANRRLAGRVGHDARRRRLRSAVVTAALTALVTALGLAAPERAGAAWAPLLRPVAHLRGPVLAPLEVAPGDARVDRGETVYVAVAAALRAHVTLHWRAIGDVPGRRVLPVDGGTAGGALGPVHSATTYWVSAPDGAVSDTFRIEPRDPLLVSDLVVDVTYPPHTRLGADHYEGDVPALRVPEGTRIEVRGRATRVLDAAWLEPEDRGEAGLGSGSGPTVAAEVEGTGFRLRWRPTRASSGRWVWRVRGAEGGEHVAGVLALTVVPDEPPRVRVTFPGDTLMPRSLRQPVVADAMDDYGVAGGVLVFRRRGAADSVVRVIGSRAGGGDAGTAAPRRLLQTVLDATGLELVPGTVVDYYVAAEDNAPSPGVGRSAKHTLQLPSMTDLRDRARGVAQTALDEARRLAEETRSLEDATRDLSRRARSAARSGGEAPGQAAPPSEPDPLAFDDAAEAEEVLDESETVLSEAEALRQRLAELERAVVEAGLEDPELARRLEELQALYEEVATPEMRQAMAEMREAVDALDSEAVQTALEELADRQEEFRRQLEDSLEMLRRAAAEQELNALARDAEEIAARQAALTGAVREELMGDEAADDPARREARGRQQAALEGRTEALSSALGELTEELDELAEEAAAEATDSARTGSEWAADAMERAAGSTRRGAGVDAAAAGDSAAGALRAVAETLDSARASLATARARAARESVQQATQEALELAEREDGLRRAMEGARNRGGLSGEELLQLRSEQAALQEGLDQLGRNLSDAGRRSAMVDRQVGQALDDARRAMERTLDGMEAPGRSLPVQQAGEAVESLNQLAMSLLQNDGRIQQAQQGGEGTQQAMQRLAQAAREQGSLNGQVSALAPMELARRAPAEQLMALARDQQGIAERVGEAGRELEGEDGALGDVEALAEEAAAIARELEAGRLDPEVRARQERLFHRLLDAGRSLEQEEYSDERVGERAGATDAVAPAPLDPALLESGLRYPVPTAAQLRGLPPAYRALILDYFDRLNRASETRPPSGGGGG